MEMPGPKNLNAPFNSSSAKRIGAVCILILTAMTYQNFRFADTWRVNLIPINEKARTAHAKELMGKKYEGSAAQAVEHANSLGIAIFNEVYRNLPTKYKSHAVDLSTMILQESEIYEVDPVFVLAVIKTESGFNPLARGRFGEIGLMQLKPDTAKWIASKYGLKWEGAKTLENPSNNVKIGMAYFDYLRERFDGHANKYVSAYNMGVGNVCRMYASEITPKNYSLRVMKHYNATYMRLAAATTLSLLAYNSDLY